MDKTFLAENLVSLTLKPALTGTGRDKDFLDSNSFCGDFSSLWGRGTEISIYDILSIIDVN